MWYAIHDHTNNKHYATNAPTVAVAVDEYQEQKSVELVGDEEVDIFLIKTGADSEPVTYDLETYANL